MTTYHYRDSTSLTKWLTLSLYALIAISLANIVSDFLEYRLLQAMKDGAFLTEQAEIIAAQTNDSRQRLIGNVQLIIALVSGVLTLRWIHRSNWNARALGAEGMQYTPGWSIGWYFIPIMNFWKPYRAMKEIWWASGKETQRPSEAVPSILGVWWALWIANNVVGNISYRMLMQAQNITEQINASIITLIADAITIALCAALLLLVKQIQDRQSEKRALLSGRVPSLNETDLERS